MKKFHTLLIAFSLATFAGAQDIVASYSSSGTVSANTRSVDYRWTRGGSPRTGYYYYWRQYSDQSTSNQLPISLNAGPTGVKSIGTWYQPSYIGSAAGTAEFSNSPNYAEFDASLQASTQFAPNLAAHQGASVASSASEYFTFTISQSSLVTFEFVAGSNASITLTDVASNEVIWGGSTAGSFSDALDAGTYAVKVNLALSAAQDTQTGSSQNIGSNFTAAKVRVVVQPANRR